MPKRLGDDRLASLLTYLLDRLLGAQGFTAYVPATAKQKHITRCDSVGSIVTSARKAAQSVKGARCDLTLYRRYGKDPQEKSSSVNIVLPLQHKERGLELVPGKTLLVRQHISGGLLGEYEVIEVPVTSHKATWMGILDAIEQIRSPKRRG